MGGSFEKWYTKAGFVLFFLMLFTVTVIAHNHLRKFELSGDQYGNDNQQLTMAENM